MTTREVLVTGATGRIGGLVARELAERGLGPRVLVRAFAEGWAARLSDSVEQILDRRPYSLSDCLEETLRDDRTETAG